MPTEAGCNNCLYFGRDKDDLPCKKCEDANMWLPDDHMAFVRGEPERHIETV